MGLNFGQRGEDSPTVTERKQNVRVKRAGFQVFDGWFVFVAYIVFMR